MTQVHVCVVTVWLGAGESLASRASVRPVKWEETVIFADPALLTSLFAAMDTRVLFSASQEMANPSTAAKNNQPMREQP